MGYRSPSDQVRVAAELRRVSEQLIADSWELVHRARAEKAKTAAARVQSVAVRPASPPDVWGWLPERNAGRGGRPHKSVAA
jgi:hypothetical protein